MRPDQPIPRFDPTPVTVTKRLKRMITIFGAAPLMAAIKT